MKPTTTYLIWTAWVLEDNSRRALIITRRDQDLGARNLISEIKDIS
jgi:hypothetical protein